MHKQSWSNRVKMLFSGYLGKETSKFFEIGLDGITTSFSILTI